MGSIRHTLHELVSLRSFIQLLAQTVSHLLALEVMLCRLERRRSGGVEEDVLVLELLGIWAVLEMLLEGVAAVCAVCGRGGVVGCAGGSDVAWVRGGRIRFAVHGGHGEYN